MGPDASSSVITERAPADLPHKADSTAKATGAFRFDVEPSANNHFAWIRTRLAVERTYIAWLRTSVAMIGFGFTIVQFFQQLRGMPSANGREMASTTPRNLGLMLIAAGIGATIVASIQYRILLRYLLSSPYQAIAGVTKKPITTPAFVCAIILALIGMVAFVSVFFRFL